MTKYKNILSELDRQLLEYLETCPKIEPRLVKADYDVQPRTEPTPCPWPVTLEINIDEFKNALQEKGEKDIL